MSRMISITFHTNIPSPYRRHQFELLAKTFPKCVFYFSDRQQERGRPWKYDFREWKCKCRVESQWVKLVRLLMQRWGSVHVVAYSGGRVYQLVLLFSGFVRHSKLLSWNDAAFPESVPDYRKKGVLGRIKHWLFLKSCIGTYTAGDLGRRYSLNFGFRPQQIVNTFFSHDVEYFEKFREDNFVAERSRVRSELGIPRNKVVLLTVSRYIDWKRLVDLADALLLLEKNSPHVAQRCELVLIGDGEDESHIPILGELSFVRVHLLRQMPPDKVLSYYCAGDLFVFPSVGDIWGLVVNEALSMGLPVICTEHIGAAELISKGVNGQKIPVRRPDILSMVLARFVMSDSERERMSVNARSIVRTWNTQKGVSALYEFLKIYA